MSSKIENAAKKFKKIQHREQLINFSKIGERVSQRALAKQAKLALKKQEKQIKKFLKMAKKQIKMNKPKQLLQSIKSENKIDQKYFQHANQYNRDSMNPQNLFQDYQIERQKQVLYRPLKFF